MISNDYLKQIQSQNLQALLTSNPATQAAAELAAQEECISYLIQKYQVDQEFTDTLAYDPTSAAYLAASRIYLTATAYASNVAYAVGALTVQTGQVYICNTLIAMPGENFNAGHWTLLGNLNDIFYAAFPHPAFQLYFIYNKGDQVYWKGHIYRALQDTRVLGHDEILQYGSYNNVPYPNFFPDDPVRGPGFWFDQGAYAVPAGSLLNKTYFTKGDNRSQQMVMYMIDITLYHLHSRIAPRNIPELRVERYDASIAWLKMAMKGAVTANLVKLQPPQGRRIRWGSNVKNRNDFP